jgi:predicted short-subunit dehydrogenase-like oxidoreductase (DUF2520 family)
MQKNKNCKIVLLGTGNVAWHLGHAMLKSQISLIQVYGRNKTQLTTLANEWHVPFTDDLNRLSPEADIYLFALKDDAYQEICSVFPFRNACMAHTSGNVDNSVFQSLTPHGGVIYPFQTFTKVFPLAFHEVPLCIDTNDPECEEKLLFLAGKLSKIYRKVDSSQRKQLHLSGVFACNFTNALYALAKKIAEEKALDFNLLRPLIAETARKIQTHFPEEMQTGPAIRNDIEIIKNHIELLKDPQLKELYHIMTECIIKMQKNKS